MSTLKIKFWTSTDTIVLMCFVHYVLFSRDQFISFSVHSIFECHWCNKLQCGLEYILYSMVTSSISNFLQTEAKPNWWQVNFIFAFSENIITLFQWQQRLFGMAASTHQKLWCIMTCFYRVVKKVQRGSAVYCLVNIHYWESASCLGFIYTL